MTIKNKQITALVIEGKQIIYFYIGDKLIWQAIRSCFSNGYWDNKMAWNNKEAWKNT